MTSCNFWKSCFMLFWCQTSGLNTKSRFILKSTLIEPGQSLNNWSSKFYFTGRDTNKASFVHFGFKKECWIKLIISDIKIRLWKITVNFVVCISLVIRWITFCQPICWFLPCVFLFYFKFSGTIVEFNWVNGISHRNQYPAMGDKTKKIHFLVQSY